LRPKDGYANSEAMPTDPKNAQGKTPLTPAAERALAEAEARRAARDGKAADPAKESGGRSGLEPTRYGDWEKDGLASDF